MAVSSDFVKPERKTVIKDLVRTYLKLYCDRSTIHGVRYLFANGLNQLERLCWTMIVTSAIAVNCFSFLVLSQRYNDQLLVSTVDNSQYPVFNVYFPAVAICTQNRVNWRRFDEAKAMFLPRNASQETQTVFFEFVKRLGVLRFGAFSRLNKMEDIDLERLDFINVTHLALFMSFTCNEVFNSDCRWRRENYSCCDLFVLEKTEIGFCLVFNSMISEDSRRKALEDPYYPWRNPKAGEDSGLDLELKLDAPPKGMDAENGVFLMIKKPEQWSDVVYTIKGNTDTLVIIRPELTSTDISTQEISPENRGCMFNWEKSHPLYKGIRDLVYLQWNCYNVCHEEFLLQYCNCTLPMFFPRNSSLRECAASDFRCLYKYRLAFSYDKRLNEEAFVKNIDGGMLCPCLISCDALEYYVAVSSLPIYNMGSMNSSLMTIDVHYQSEVVLKYRTSREFTYLELIASFGGIIGLFLGASIVSGIEIIYHLTFGLVVFLKDNHFFTYLHNRIRGLHTTPATPSNPASSTARKAKAAWHTSTNKRRRRY